MSRTARKHLRPISELSPCPPPASYRPVGRSVGEEPAGSDCSPEQPRQSASSSRAGRSAWENEGKECREEVQGSGARKECREGVGKEFIVGVYGRSAGKK